MTRSNGSKNNEVDNTLKTPPTSKRGTGRGRGSARGAKNGRGRGRGNVSADTSPILGAVGGDLDLSQDNSIDVEEVLTEAELALSEEELLEAIAAEEKRGRLLEQQRRLAILKKENCRKAHDLRQIANDRTVSKRSARVVFNEIDNLPRMNEASGRSLLTLADIDVDGVAPSIASLRARPDLQHQVDQQLDELDVVRLQQRSGSTGAGAGLQTGRLQLGRTAKSDYGVVRLIIWPHTRVFSKIGATLSYDKLDLASLVVGELTIISDSATSDAERKARILQLIRVCNYSRSFEWSLVREYHAAYLSAVERSISGDWFSIDVNDIAAQVLFLVPRHQVVAPVQIQNQGGAQGGAPYRKFEKSAKNSGIYFCSAFSKGVCPHKGTHKAVVSGRLKTVDHICANCLLVFDEVHPHPETECPRATTRRSNIQNNNFNNEGNVGH